MQVLNRLLLLATALLAAYQVAVGIDGLSTVPIISYTIAFGVLLVATLLMLILGFEILDSPLVVIVSTIIPLSLSFGLMWEYLQGWRTGYLVFVILGFLAVVVTRVMPSGRVATFVLAFVHGVAGLVIFFLPIILSFTGQLQAAFIFVGIGGGLIGVAGLLLSFLRTGRPLLPKETILKLLPGLLALTTLAFVIGFSVV